MKTNVLKLFMLTGLMITFAWQVNAQCKQVGLIGEFTGWAEDHVMSRDLDSPDLFTTIVSVDTDDDGNGFSDLKFRVLGDWGTNWGSADFPTGTGVANGDNIPVPFGTYFVTFNCTTGEYSFEETCGVVSMIGEFNGWSGDYAMERSADNPNMWTTFITFDENSDQYGDSLIVEAKFRMDADWVVNWGGEGFPSDTAVQDGPNIQAPFGTYKVSFNCATGVYDFEETCGEISMIGEFNGWSDDYPMVRSADDPNQWTSFITFNEDSDQYGDSLIVELKFRQGADWATNWGGDTWPAGTGTQDGANIQASFGTYKVSFNCTTGDYSFEETCGDVSMIGAFNGWNGDVEMNRDAADPNMWTLYRSWNKDSQVKFRQNKDWSVNWGNDTWPTGTATANGPNVPLVAGKYDISFNCNTGDYDFTENDSYCGEIGMVGDFNDWGLENGDGFYTDEMLQRDPAHPSNFTLNYTFPSGTNLLFRMDGDLSFTNVWGGAFPSGTGVQDPSQFIAVPGGTYNITFNCLSGDFYFERLGSSVYAPKVFAIDVDGIVGEKDWVVNEPVSKLIEGEAGEDPLEAFFGTAYNDDYFFIGGLIKDANIGADGASIGFDGDKSGGALDEHDISFGFDAISGTVIMEHGPADYTPEVKTAMTADGWSFEVGILWSALGITPEAGTQVSMEMGIQDVDGSNLAKYAWNGDLVSGPSSYGSVNLGTLACGDISMYSDAIGDVSLRPTSNDDGTNTNTYVGTYEFETDMNVIFRKDGASTVSWGASDFPGGTATVGGDMIPATAGRYRVSFGCLDGAYSFTEEAAGAGVAYSQFTEEAVTLDGDLTEFNLAYGMDAGVVAGSATENNTVTWGSVWDKNNVYFGVSVIDAVVEGSGNPWDNDAIEFYFDGNHDSDGTYDGDFDTQIIMDIVNADVPWVKADGVPITDIEGKWFLTSSGYNVELRIGWADFGFVPARNRAMGFTIGNNDSDNGIGRDYQTAWFGTGDNWNNTAVHGDLQLAGGDLFSKVNRTFYNEQITVYPNPAYSGRDIYILADSELFTGETKLKIYNLFGQLVSEKTISFNGNAERIETNNLTAGTYFIHLINVEGKQAVKQIIVN